MIATHLTIRPQPPIEDVAFSFEGISMRLHVQRNELIHPLISGNKWRKLEAFFGDAYLGYQSIGGAWSNHLLALAAMGKMLGKPTVGWIRGEEVRSANKYEDWLNQLGMRVHYLSRAAYKHKEAVYALAQRTYPEYRLIPEGGHPQPHFKAFENWLQELPDSYTHFLIGCGTGATLTGMAHALQAKPRKVHLIGISAIHLPQEIQRLNSEALAIWPQTTIEGPMDGKRFGKISGQRLEISKALFQQTGIVPDPVYDASVLLWFQKAVVNGFFCPHDRVLWLHSGGITSWAGYPLECHKLFGL